MVVGEVCRFEGGHGLCCSFGWAGAPDRWRAAHCSNLATKPNPLAVTGLDTRSVITDTMSRLGRLDTSMSPVNRPACGSEVCVTAEIALHLPHNHPARFMPS
jgi:hypothetical protein